MEKSIIKNRNNKNIAVLVDDVVSPKGLVFVAHGLGGIKELPNMKAFAEAFVEEGFTAVRFDARNTFGESEGDYGDASVTSYCEDLENVIEWAKKQSWYQEPFYLIGHSLGSISIALYAQNHPEKVKGLAPISVVVSGKLWEQLHDKQHMEKWKKDGVWHRGESFAKPGAMRILKWSFAEDIMKYDLLEKVHKLTMPVLLAVGELDTGTPLAHHQLLFDALPGKKELHVIKGSDHNFNDEQLGELKIIIKKWITTN